MGAVRNIAFKLLYHLKVGNILLKMNRKKNLVPVLVMHKVIPEYDATWPGIHPLLFEQILTLLKKHYTILPISDLYSKPAHELTNACFITFDDGYKDYLDYAYPILKRHNVPSALFVLPYQISNKGHIWTSTISFFIKHYTFNEIANFFLERGILIDDNRDDYFHLNLDISRKLCKIEHAQRITIINDLREKFKADSRIIENELLSFDELRALDPKLTEIESHSLTHPSFKIETDETFINTELKESKEILEKELQKEVKAFAFPFAEYNDLAIQTVKKYYKLCFTGINDFVDLNKLKNSPDEVFFLTRFYVHQETAEEVFLLINGFHKKIGR